MPFDKPPKIAAYLRVSTAEQQETGTIATQRHAIGEYVKYKKYSTPVHYEDEAVSGSKAFYERPQGSALWKAIEAREIDLLIAYKLDRLGRRIKYVIDFVDHCAEHNVKIEFTNDSLDLSNEQSKMMLGIMATFAENERDVFRRRSLDGKRRKSEQGKIITNPPFGYLVENGNLVIDELRAPVVKLILERYARGDSSHTIVLHLNEMKSPKPLRSKPGDWKHDTVMRYLRNPAYYGEYQAFRSDKIWDGKRTKIKRDKSEIITIPCPAIVSRATWDEVQKMITANTTMGPASKKRTYLLRGLIKCGRCGLNYVGHTAHSHKYKTKAGAVKTYGEHKYYNCASNSGRDYKFCGNAYVRADDLEAAVWAEIEKYLRNPQDVIDKILKLEREKSNNSNKIAGSIGGIEKQEKHLAGKKTRIVLAISDGSISNADAASAIAELNAEIDALALRKSALKKDLESESADGGRREINSIRTVIESLAARVAAGFSEEDKAYIMRTLVEKIVINSIENDGGEEGKGGGGAKAETFYKFSPKVYSANDASSLSPASRKNINARPRNFFEPALVRRLTRPPEARPYSDENWLVIT